MCLTGFTTTALLKQNCPYIAPIINLSTLSVYSNCEKKDEDDDDDDKLTHGNENKSPLLDIPCPPPTFVRAQGK